jgi:GNAT superfamily N-acetyltransferase
MEYQIARYSPEYESQIIELQTRHNWGPEVGLNAAYLKWKYDDNPYLKHIKPRLIYMALCDGQVVGMRGIYGAKWQIGYPPQTLPVLGAGDLVIAPGHRNRGLFTKIMQAALDDLSGVGCKFVLNLSASPVAFLGSLAMGWRSVGSLQNVRWRGRRGTSTSRVVRYAKRLPFFRSASRRVCRYMNGPAFHSVAKKLDPFYFMDRSAQRRLREINPDVTIQETPRSEDMAELVKSIGSDGRLRHVRDYQYFAYRFQNPLAMYRFFFWGATKLEGYLILQKSIYPYHRGVSIVDWEATNARVRADLLQAAIHCGQWYGFGSLLIWSATLPDETIALLQKSDFKSSENSGSITRFGPTVLIRPVHDEMLKGDYYFADRRLLDLANWDLRKIYSDGC